MNLLKPRYILERDINSEESVFCRNSVEVYEKYRPRNPLYEKLTYWEFVTWYHYIKVPTTRKLTVFTKGKETTQMGVNDEYMFYKRSAP